MCLQECRNTTAPPTLKTVSPHKYLNQRNQKTVEVYGSDMGIYNDTGKLNNKQQTVIYKE
jgi:hypothetical protein